jgi:carboxymethylenebutenolidase
MCHPETIDEDLNVGIEEVAVPLGSGDVLPATLCTPKSDGGPGVLVITDIYGRTGFYRWIAARLAASGYVALLPDYFHRLDEPEPKSREAAFARYASLDEVASLDALRVASSWLEERAEAPGSGLGVLGFCLGGTLGLCLAMSRADLTLATFYGFPRGVQAPCARKVPPPIEHTRQIQGRILSFWGDADYITVGEIAEFADAMAISPADYDHRVYHRAGHGFLGDLGGTGQSHTAAADAWSRTLAFYADSLRGE